MTTLSKDTIHRLMNDVKFLIKNPLDNEKIFINMMKIIY